MEQKSATDRAMDAVEGLVSDMKKSVGKLGPQAVSAARAAVQVSAINWIIRGVTGAVVCVVGGVLLYWSIHNLPAIPANCGYDCIEAIKQSRNGYWITMAIGAGMAVFGWIAFYCQLFDAFTWTALRRPEVWIADKVLNRFLDPPSDD